VRRQTRARFAAAVASAIAASTTGKLRQVNCARPRSIRAGEQLRESFGRHFRADRLQARCSAHIRRWLDFGFHRHIQRKAPLEFSAPLASPRWRARDKGPLKTARQCDAAPLVPPFDPLDRLRRISLKCAPRGPARQTKRPLSLCHPAWRDLKGTTVALLPVRDRSNNLICPDPGRFRNSQNHQSRDEHSHHHQPQSQRE